MKASRENGLVDISTSENIQGSYLLGVGGLKLLVLWNPSRCA